MDGMKIRLFFWIFWTLGSSQAQDIHQDNPNIVFILTDDQGYNGVSWHNSKIITPNLHHLYNTGVHLSNYYVQPICSPTRSALMTGYYPYHLGRQRSVITSSMPTGLTLSKTLLPERLRDLGYRNHIVGKWHLGFCDWAYTPTRRGFDTFYGYYHGMEDYYSHIVDDGYDFRDNDRVATEANGTYSTYLLGDRAVEIIQEESTKSGPFFLYLPLQSIHSPFQVPAEYTALYPDESPFDSVYYGMLTAMDDVVGRVTDALNSSGLMDNTVVIFSSDNGSPFNERNHPLRGTKLTLWEGGTKSNGIINSPLIQNTPRNYTGLIHVTDWFNTVLSIAGGTADDNNDGFDQWNSIKTGSSGPRDSFVYNLDVEDGHVFGAIRVGKYKLFLGQETEHQSNIWLTDLEADPNETIDLSEENPDITNELKDLLTAQLSSLVPHDDPRSDDAGNPSNYGGVWSPGWCTATTTTTK